MSAGLAKLTIADTVNSPPNNAQAQRAGTSSVERDVLDAERQEHEPDEDADGGHGRLVELKNDQSDGDPRDSGGQQDPPVAGGFAHRVAHRRMEGVAELWCCSVFVHDLPPGCGCLYR